MQDCTISSCSFVNICWSNYKSNVSVRLIILEERYTFSQFSTIPSVKDQWKGNDKQQKWAIKHKKTTRAWKMYSKKTRKHDSMLQNICHCCVLNTHWFYFAKCNCKYSVTTMNKKLWTNLQQIYRAAYLLNNSRGLPREWDLKLITRWRQSQMHDWIFLFVSFRLKEESGWMKLTVARACTEVLSVSISEAVSWSRSPRITLFNWFISSSLTFMAVCKIRKILIKLRV